MKLGLIAGNGRFPFLVLDAARDQGYDVTIIAAKEETCPELNEAAARHGVPIHWISLGQLSRCISLLQEAGVTHALMAGQVKHTKIFSAGIVPDLMFSGLLKHLVSRNTDGLIGAVANLLRERGIELLTEAGVSHAVMAGQVKHTKIFAGGLRLDATFMGLLARLPFRNTDGLIGAVAGVLRDNGIELIDSTSLLTPLLAGAGVMTKRAPTTEERQDFEFGYRMADAIAGLDIGQTIAVKHKAVVAVEAMDGTDEVIGRAGYLAGAGVRIIKVAKPNQDMRFDVPVVGLATVQAMRAAGASALSLDAGKTLMFERDALLASADDAGITIVGRERK